MRHTIEPGLLRVFRYFALVAAAYFAVHALYSSAETGGVVDVRQARAQLSMFAYMLLVLYLSLPWFQRRLGAAYLPIAIAVATVAPLVSSLAFTALGGAPLQPADSGLWAAFPVLFIPLILIAWQYGFAWVMVFVVAMIAVDGLLVLRSIPRLDFSAVPLFASVLVRAFAIAIVGHIVTELVGTLREQQQSLMRANVALAREAATQERLAVSQERNRLARELHDTLAHTLTGQAVTLEAMRASIPAELTEVHRSLDRSLEATRAGLNETRRALRALRAQPLEDVGLKGALRMLAESVTWRGGLDLEVSLPPEALTLPPEQEQCVYRIAQEALENVLRHANATSVSVRGAVANGIFTLMVEDNGRGFDPMAPASDGRFGVLGMRERAELLGGTLDVESPAAKGGTRIVLRMGVRE